MNLYELKNIDKIYGNSLENHALNHINLTIQEKEMVVILGPSGSGKSTLLNILSGIDKPTNGIILFQNIKLNQLNSVIGFYMQKSLLKRKGQILNY